MPICKASPGFTPKLYGRLKGTPQSHMGRRFKAHAAWRDGSQPHRWSVPTCPFEESSLSFTFQRILQMRIWKGPSRRILGSRSQRFMEP